MREEKGKRQEGMEEKKKTSGLIKHLLDSPICAKRSERGPLWEGGGERGRLRGGGRSEKKGGGDGGTVPTSTSARNCFFGGEKCIIMKAGAGRKSTANAKSLRKQLKCHCFSRPAQIPDIFISLSLCFHTSFQMIFSPKEIPHVFFFNSLSEGFSDWYARGSALLIRCVSPPLTLLHLTSFFYFL